MIEKGIVVKKITKCAGVGVLLSALTLGATGIAIEVNTDHVNKLCPLVKVFGLEHQANNINSHSNEYLAIYYPDTTVSRGYTLNGDGTASKYVDAKKTIVNGETTYNVPVGYTLEGNMGVQTIFSDERVEVYEKDNTTDAVKTYR